MVYNLRLIYVPVNDSDVIQHGIIPALIKQITKQVRIFVFLLFLMQAKRFTFFQEVDMIPFAFVITPTLMLLMDFTIPLTVEDYHLLQPYPKEESHLTACLRPFSFTVQYMNSYSILDLITFNWQAINWFII
jgi:hypothetical protein